MKKLNKKSLILTSAVTLIPMIIGLFLWEKLPDTIPTHFAMDGTPDDWSSKAFAVFGLPVFLLLIHWLCVGFTMADPKSENMSNALFKIVLWICPVTSVYATLGCYGAALGMQNNTGRITSVLVGIVLLLVGNYLPKCKQNYTMGIKLPWTLADEENWNKTHRMAGFLWVAGGFFVILNAFFWKEWFFFVIMVIMVVVPAAYSFWYYKKKK